MVPAFGVRPQLGKGAVKGQEGAPRLGSGSGKRGNEWPRRCHGGPEQSGEHDQSAVQDPK